MSQRIHDQIVRIFDKLDLQTKGSLNEVWKKLEELGWRVKREFSASSACYDKTWEHDLVKQHNDGLSSNAVLSSWFVTLYKLKEDIDASTGDFGFSNYVFTFGRLGNTSDWKIWVPTEYVEERQDVRDQMLLF